jgi:hypothetical protein
VAPRRGQITVEESHRGPERLRAAEQLENRGMGKPKETVEHQCEDNPLRAELLQIPPEERRAWLRRLNGLERPDEAAEH